MICEIDSCILVTWVTEKLSVLETGWENIQGTEKVQWRGHVLPKQKSLPGILTNIKQPSPVPPNMFIFYLDSRQRTLGLCSSVCN